jgi:hypothetical protein
MSRYYFFLFFLLTLWRVLPRCNKKQFVERSHFSVYTENRRFESTLSVLNGTENCTFEIGGRIAYSKKANEVDRPVGPFCGCVQHRAEEEGKSSSLIPPPRKAQSSKRLILSEPVGFSLSPRP